MCQISRPRPAKTPTHKRNVLLDKTTLAVDDPLGRKTGWGHSAKSDPHGQKHTVIDHCHTNSPVIWSQFYGARKEEASGRRYDLPASRRTFLHFIQLRYDSSASKSKKKSPRRKGTAATGTATTGPRKDQIRAFGRLARQLVVL